MDEKGQSLLTSAATIVESRLHAVQRVASEGQGKPALLVPIRFVVRNKLTKDDRSLLAFDAFVLSEMLGLENGVLVCPECHADRMAMQNLTPIFQEHLRQISEQAAVVK